MRKKLPILLLTIVFLLQAFIPAVYAASKNEVAASSASFCPFDTTSEGAGSIVVRRYQVGTFDELSKLSKPNDGLEIHHVVQKHPAGQIIDGYEQSMAPSIALPRMEHRTIPNLRGDYSGSARDLLSRDIRNLRNYTDAPNSSLKELINLNKEMYSDAFRK